jgi:LacI family transcriptional regulator
MLLPWWSSYFEKELTQGIEAAQQDLRSYNINILIERYETGTADECLECLDSLVDQGIHGIAICAKNLPGIQQKLSSIVQKGIPVVTFNTDISDCRRLCFVGQDFIKEGRIGAAIMAKLFTAL